MNSHVRTIEPNIYEKLENLLRVSAYPCCNNPQLLYIGHTSNARERLLKHYAGNVDISTVRKTIATEMGFGVQKGAYVSMTTRRVGLSEEIAISLYMIRTTLKYAACSSAEMARDYHGYLIERLRPPLNKKTEKWNKEKESRYSGLTKELDVAPVLASSQLEEIPPVPIVYLLYHEYLPASGLIV